MPAYVTIRGGPYPGVSRARIRRWAERMLGALELQNAELSLLLTDDDTIRLLNRAHRCEDRPTDVLAFAMREGDAKAPEGGPAADMLGDVVISIPTAARHAKKGKRTVDAELRMLLAHGLLHLLGHDHPTRALRRTMVARARALCDAACKPGTRRQ